MHKVCIDASLALKWVLPEIYTNRAQEVLRNWLLEGVSLVAPTLFIYEIASALRNKVHRQVITLEEGFLALNLNQIRSGNIELIYRPELVEMGWAISERLGLPTAYDSFYLALAEHEGCEFWTADENLVNRLENNKIKWARWIGGS
jgi:predicted nucleic acid-binding protein